MKCLRPVFFFASILLALTLVVSAQNNTSSWPYSVEINNSTAPGMFQVIVPFVVLEKATKDLSDLRIYDGKGQEIPYAIRLREESNSRQSIGANIFNQATVGSSTEVWLDLGENPSSHNEIELDTDGNNFRRRVVVEGSDTRDNWRTLSQNNLIFSFTDQNSSVNSNHVSYPTSEYRYLRVRVLPDELTDNGAPRITGARVMIAVKERGELSTWSVRVPGRELLRNQGAPSSSWNIDLGGRVPCDRLTLEIYDDSFSRHFELENVDDPQNIRRLASGELVRRVDSEKKPLTINFDQEERVQKLRLVVNDYSNQPLGIDSIAASAPARQLVFELKESPAQPLRLYFGSAKITAPNYDFEKNLPDKLKAEPTQVSLGGVVANPSFIPEPLPFTERLPWLIYLVLASATAALAWILLKLARRVTKAAPMSDEL
jgi:hypothetical protein